MRSKDGEEVFFEVINSHKGIIYKISNSYCKDAEDRKDIIQEIVIQLWKSFDQYNNEYKYSTWIYRIALNVAISWYRKQTVRSRMAYPLTRNIFNFSEINQNEESEENFNLLQRFINELKELDRGLMLLYLEEKSYKEIADIIGITETNVATKISRIKIALRQKFEAIKQS